ncbi:hypothetical protein PIB30_064581 [Stylosanthes scabra]|uniref:FBD domain-containing protein n=1 Tax=Stylosanthes scabra TaxID=79078 RepID=A0ABU6VNH5_9FABA|nr:hypothetical protein [Stylosanthes scabra]
MVEPAWPRLPKQHRQEILENNNLEDRISALPNPVLCHILSFVPTKTAVRTTVLSPGWRHLWKNLNTLDFSDDSHELFDETGESFKRFANFVNNVLDKRNEPHDIHVLRLSCGHSNFDPVNASSISAWVRATIGPNLKEFTLTLFANDALGFVMPHSLLSCTKLVTLSLSGCIHVLPKYPLIVDLLSLKTLFMDIDYLDSFDEILKKCPVLETLCASFVLKQPMRVCMPQTLKTLKLAIKNKVAAAIEVHASGLACVSFAHAASNFNYIVGDLNNVTEVCLNIYATHEPIYVLLNLLDEIRMTKILALHRLTTKWLLQDRIQVFPDFDHLIRLEIIFPWFDSTFLMSLLHRCYILQDLKIQIEEELPIVSQTWTEPTNDFPCLESCLSSFHFVGYLGIHDETKFVGYILKRGLVLNTINIDLDESLDINTKNDVLMKLFAMSRASPLCQANIC